MPARRLSLIPSLGLLLAVATQVTNAAVIERSLSTDPTGFAAIEFDFVIVGGGTAGLAVAARLAEKSWKVGVIEAGQYRPNDPLIDIPKNFGSTLGNANYDWIYLTTPQENVNNRVIVQNRGKVLGGSSAINFEIFNRPAALEYSAWSALNLGQGGWSWDGLLPYFKKSETYTPPLAEDSFPNPSPTRRGLKGRDETDTTTDNSTLVLSSFFGSADSALNFTALDVGSLIAAAGVADTLSAALNGTDTNSTTTDVTDPTTVDSTDVTDPTTVDSTDVARRSNSNDNVHGFNGPVQESFNTWYSDIASPFIKTAVALGIDINTNPDSGNNIGIYNSGRAVNPSNQTRSYAAPAYYAPNSYKPNLVVLTGAQATKINFGSKDWSGSYSATGVTYSYNGNLYTVKASKEIILSGGVFNTPQLLEHSGIGNKDILSDFNIQTLVDLPGVGENLQDHQMAPCSFTLKPGHHTWDELRNNATFAAAASAQYASSKTGILTSTISVLTFLPLQKFISDSKYRSILSSVTSELLSKAGSFSLLQWAQYVIQLAWLYNTNIPQVEFVMIPGFQPTGNVAAPSPGTSYLVVSPVIQHPFSRGTVHITSTDALAKPAVNPNYLSSVFDKMVLRESLKFIRTMASTAPLSDVIQSFNDPPASTSSDDEFDAYAVKALASLKHPVGTAALAPRSLGGVVGNDLMVYGTKNLRVADASVFPMHVSAHAQSTTYAIGEKAADIIKSVWS